MPDLVAYKALCNRYVFSNIVLKEVSEVCEFGVAFMGDVYVQKLCMNYGKENINVLDCIVF